VDQCRASFLSAAAKELSNLARLIEPRIKAETAVSAGVEWAQIVEYATNHRVGLIIMSTHGRSGVKHILMGSVAERVVRHAPCAVMVVREHEPLSLTAP
jgi:nucleotide-binding universal stress UspA family protein